MAGLRHALFFALWAALLLTACSDTGPDRPERPDDLLDEDRYIDILAELHIVQALEDTYQDTTLHEQALERVLENYDVRHQQFQSTHNYYMRADPGRQRERMEKVRERLNHELQTINEEVQNRREQQQEQQEPEDPEDRDR